MSVSDYHGDMLSTYDPSQDNIRQFLIDQLSTPTPIIKDTFGSKASISDLMANFDYSSSNDWFHTSLAPAYGSLTTASFKMMDDQLKIMLASSLRSIRELPIEQRDFHSIVTALVENPFLVGDPAVGKADSLRKSGTTFFKDGGIDQGIVNEVLTWFTGLVANEDVLKDTKIDVNLFGRMVGQTGAAVNSFETVFHNEVHRRKNMIDIGVIRFPDISHPYIQVYTIKLNAWSDSIRDLWVETDFSGVNGSYMSMIFRPNPEAMKLLSPGLQTQAVDDAEAVFGS